MTAKKATTKKSEGFERKFGVHVRKCACGSEYRTEAKRGRPFKRCPACRKG